MALGKIDHIECYVGDLEKAKKYLTEKMGFKFLRSLGDAGTGIQLKSPAGDFTLDFFQGSEEAYKRQQRVKPGGLLHLNHIAFKVDDINKEFEELKSKGVTTQSGADAPGFNPLTGRLHFGVLDADGCYWIQVTD